MSFQQGTVEILAEATSVTVPFPVPFTAAPAGVFVNILNTSGDSVKVPIAVLTTSISATDFTVQLSPTPATDNYVLSWSAGDTNVAFQSPVPGRRINQFAPIAEITDAIVIVGVADGVTGLITVGQLREGAERGVFTYTPDPTQPTSFTVPDGADQYYVNVIVSGESTSTFILPPAAPGNTVTFQIQFSDTPTLSVTDGTTTLMTQTNDGRARKLWAQFVFGTAWQLAGGTYF